VNGAALLKDTLSKTVAKVEKKQQGGGRAREKRDI
jgi:hypothetical protein